MIEKEQEKRLVKDREKERAKRVEAEEAKQKIRLRGHPRDELDVRISKTLSYLLRHGAVKDGLDMRADGYVRVTDLVSKALHSTGERHPS